MLSVDNFVNYAMRHYDNPSCRTIDDFNEDIMKFTLVRKLLSKVENNTVNIRLLLNHLTVLFNVFEREACVSMLFFKTDKAHWHYLVTILDYLNYLPEYVFDVGINTTLINKDDNMLTYLREI